MLLSVSNAKANSCDEVSPNPSIGEFTKECINRVLTNYVTYVPNGYFVIQISEEMNVYVQGIRDLGNSFLFEAVGSKYSDRITQKVMNSLVKLGWNLPGDSGNFDQIIQIDQILNQEAAGLLYQTLDSYSLEKNDIILTYFMNNP